MKTAALALLTLLITAIWTAAQAQPAPAQYNWRLVENAGGTSSAMAITPTNADSGFINIISRNANPQRNGNTVYNAAQITMSYQCAAQTHGYVEGAYYDASGRELQKNPDNRRNVPNAQLPATIRAMFDEACGRGRAPSLGQRTGPIQEGVAWLGTVLSPAAAAQAQPQAPPEYNWRLLLRSAGTSTAVAFVPTNDNRGFIFILARLATPGQTGTTRYDANLITMGYQCAEGTHGYHGIVFYNAAGRDVLNTVDTRRNVPNAQLPANLKPLFDEACGRGRVPWLGERRTSIPGAISWLTGELGSGSSAKAPAPLLGETFRMLEAHTQPAEGRWSVVLTRRGQTNTYDGVWTDERTRATGRDSVEVAGVQNGQLVIRRGGGTYSFPVNAQGGYGRGDASWAANPTFYADIYLNGAAPPPTPALAPRDMGRTIRMAEVNPRTSERWDWTWTRRGASNVYDGVSTDRSGARGSDIMEVLGVEGGRLLMWRRSGANAFYHFPMDATGRPGRGTVSWVKEPSFYVEIVR
jgi:hypothetical protein